MLNHERSHLSKVDLNKKHYSFVDEVVAQSYIIKQFGYDINMLSWREVSDSQGLQEPAELVPSEKHQEDLDVTKQFDMNA